MPIVGVTVTKETAFRASIQPFTNMYFYDTGLGLAPNATQAEALLDAVKNIEQGFHSSGVEFTYGRVWLQTLLQITSEMIFQKPLGGNGTAALVSGMDKERAYLFRWRAGNDSRGNPVYLRKWYHSCGQFGSGSGAIGSGTLDNTIPFTLAQRNAMAALVAPVANITASGVTFQLTAKSGRDITGSNTPECHQFLEHHQLGDQWRGA